MTKLNQFQIAVLRSCTDSHEETGEKDAKRFLAKLRKDGSGGLAALVEELGSASNISEAATLLVNAEMELKRAMAGLGRLSMELDAARRHTDIVVVNEDVPLQPEMA
jgi:hypothetical protein